MTPTKPYLEPRLEISFGEKKPEGLTFVSKYTSGDGCPALYSMDVHSMFAYALHNDCGEKEPSGPIVPEIPPNCMGSVLRLSELTVLF